MMRKKLLFTLMALPLLGFGQLSIDTTGETFAITFDQTTSGVNNGIYDGTSFNSPAAPGGLNSEAFSFSSIAGVSMNFGGSATGNPPNRGNSNGGVTSKGFYAFNTSTFGTDRALGWQSDTTDFDPGQLTLKVMNNSGTDINNARFGYTFASLNNTNNSTKLSVAFSLDSGVTFTDLPELSDSSAIASNPGSGWSADQKRVLIKNINWTDNNYVLFQFTSESGVRNVLQNDEVALDNIFVIGYDVDFIFDGAAWNVDPSDTFAAASAIVFPGDSAVISGSTTLEGISVLPGAKLYIPDSSELTISEFGRFEADANGYAQLYGALLGSISSYETYLNSEQGRWFNFAVPNEASLSDIAGLPVQANGNASTTNAWYLDATVDTNSDGFGEWTPFTSMAANLEGIGFQVYAGDGDYFGSAPFTARTTGRFVNGDVVIEVSSNTTDNFNLLPNPYPSILDYQDVYDNIPDMGSTYYIQDGTPDTAGATIFYRSYNASNGSNQFGGTRYIAPGMSYFTTYSGAQTEVTFTNAMRNIQADPNRYKTVKPFKDLELRVQSLSNDYHDGTYIFFGDQLSDQLNTRYDGLKMMNKGYPNLYSVVAGNDFVYNGLNDQFTSKDVDLHFQGDYAGFYEIEMPEITVPNTWTIELEDKLTGNIVNLRKSTYLFQHNSSNDEDRFILHINKNGVSVSEEEQARMFSFIESDQVIAELGDLQNVAIKVFAINGSLVAELDDQESRATIDASAWSEGVYILKAYQNGQEIHTNKIIK